MKGRGNKVKYHKGNKYYHGLVLKHKLECARCPKKSQKRKFAELIYDEIKALDPPTRFLEQDKNTKLWGDIGEKNAMNTILQALREGVPELTKNGTTEGNNNLFNEHQQQQNSLQATVQALNHEQWDPSDKIRIFKCGKPGVDMGVTSIEHYLPSSTLSSVKLANYEEWSVEIPQRLEE